MSTLAILVAFALMLFLPCAIAVLGGREPDDDSATSVRRLDPIVRNRIPQPIIPAAAVATAITKPKIETWMPAPNVTTNESRKQKITDPSVTDRNHRAHQARILRNEIEALMASAAAARAQADALAANARLASAKAEVAQVQARAAEERAAAAIQEMRRAA